MSTVPPIDHITPAMGYTDSNIDIMLCALLYTCIPGPLAVALTLKSDL